MRISVLSFSDVTIVFIFKGSQKVRKEVLSFITVTWIFIAGVQFLNTQIVTQVIQIVKDISDSFVCSLLKLRKRQDLYQVLSGNSIVEWLHHQDM